MVTRFHFHGGQCDPREAMSHVTRWTVDLSSNSDEFESVTRLTETAGEFPHIDDRFTGLPYRYGWMLEMDHARAVQVNGGSPPALRPPRQLGQRPRDIGLAA